ncbi:hypothetical protein ACWGPO_10950 [Achromobacter animicus]
MYRHSRLRSRIAQSLHRLCAVLPVLLLAALLAPAAHAQSSAPLQCGLYEYDGGRGQMRVLSSNLIRKSALNGPELLYYKIENGKLGFYNLDLGLDDEYKLAPDGKSIDVGFEQVYVLKTPAPCAAPTELPQTKVWPLCWKAGLMECLDAYNETSVKELESMCASGLPFVCKKLPDAWREAGGLEPGEGGQPAPLGEAAHKTLQAACLKGISASTCTLAAEEAWSAGRYLDARPMLQHACAAPIASPDACTLADSLAPLTAEALAQAAPAQLPQGTFKRPIGTLRKLVFGADGVVKDDGSLTMKARREGGLIKMQHNQGGDFVLKPLGDRLLLGVDYWNRLALFVRADN